MVEIARLIRGKIDMIFDTSRSNIVLVFLREKLLTLRESKKEYVHVCTVFFFKTNVIIENNCIHLSEMFC